MFVTLCGLALCLAVRAPRGLAMGLLLIGLALLTFASVFHIAVGPQDSQSERDDAVELAAETLIAGGNPWANPTRLGAPITTGPADLLAHNPLTAAGNMLGAAWPETNPMFRLLNGTVGALGSPTAGAAKAVLGVAGICFVARRAARNPADHPFWHMTFAALLACFLVYPAAVYDDYALCFAVPAFFAIAHSPTGFGAPTAVSVPSARPTRTVRA